jgi:hypothetical protein
MLRYWRALLGGRFKLWQLIALGSIWIAVGGVMILRLGDAGMGMGGLLVASGVAHFVIAAIGVKMHDHIEAKIDKLDERNERALRKREKVQAEIEDPPIPAAPKPAAPAPEVRPMPPRIGNDPFRDPPAGKPLALVHTATPPRDVPVARSASDGEAAEKPEDKPKFLA